MIELYNDKVEKVLTKSTAFDFLRVGVFKLVILCSTINYCALSCIRYLVGPQKNDWFQILCTLLTIQENNIISIDGML